MTSTSVPYPKPARRRLRIYAFDPHASVSLETAVINDLVVELPWETKWEAPLQVGPVNDYLEVIDYDPASGVFYEPVELNDPFLLAQDGLPPSEGRPQFHQQMVFAVAMRTIRTFERALGRGVLWAGDSLAPQGSFERRFTPRLRIYPHALREANAYYSPDKRALLFGYFRPTTESSADVDASWVFTCLSQDIIAHETAHAILHGLQPQSIESSHVDALAFHEAFADIVALLQHFSMGDVLKHELAQSRGSLRTPGLLSDLAEQFGRATGRRGALRRALDLLALDARRDAGQTVRKSADDAPAETIDAAVEPHERGSFLVAAIYDAFVTIYERRTADLLQIGRTSATRRGDPLSPQLVARLAAEAAKSADHVLRMCVRAIDYIPPVSVRFGEYLRAIITADTDLVPDDPLRYRVAFAEAFRNRNITVPGCISMAPDSLLWAPPDPENFKALCAQKNTADPLSAIFLDLLSQLRLNVSFDGEVASYQSNDFQKDRNLRDLAMQIVMHNEAKTNAWLYADSEYDRDWENLLGLRLIGLKGLDSSPSAIELSSIPMDDKGNPEFKVQSTRIARRWGPSGEELHQLIIQVTQRRRAYFDEGEQEAADRDGCSKYHPSRWDNPDFWFYGGATIHVDLRDGTLVRVIRKRIDNNDRLKAEKAYRSGDTSEAAAGAASAEPFAFMHRLY